MASIFDLPGHFYRSEFHSVEWTISEVKVQSTAVSTVIFQGKGSVSVVVHGQNMTSSTVAIGRLDNSNWARVVIIDSAGKRAFCQPIWRDATGVFQETL